MRLVTAIVPQSIALLKSSIRPVFVNNVARVVADYQDVRITFMDGNVNTYTGVTAIEVSEDGSSVFHAAYNADIDGFFEHTGNVGIDIDRQPLPSGAVLAPAWESRCLEGVSIAV